MRNPDGSLNHRYRDGEVSILGYIDDYAFTIWSLIELYEATFELKYLKTALELNDYLIEHFWDETEGGFYFTDKNGEKLIVRQKEIYDGAIPSGNSVAALNLIRLGRITANLKFENMSRMITTVFSEQVANYPAGYSQLMVAVDFLAGPTYEIIIAGDHKSDDTQKMLVALGTEYVPNKIVLLRPSGKPGSEILEIAAYLKSQTSIDGKATAYVCSNYACRLPTTEVDSMLNLIRENGFDNHIKRAKIQQ